MYKILITGSKGFIGKNLITKFLKTRHDIVILEYDIDNSIDELDDFCKDCDFVYNFAAVHRPKDSSDFFKTNTNQFEVLLQFLEKHKNNCPVLYTSSIQATNGTDYGNSKLFAENLLKKHSEKCNSRGIVYRLTNTFGRWAKPNSHSVVATFCYNIANDIPIFISDENIIMHFAYIDDVVDSLYERFLEGKIPLKNDEHIYSISKNKIIDISLGELGKLISSFKTISEPTELNNKEKLFYKTYLSYLDYEKQQK